jgi:flagellar basal-body rod modification protein FlgD
MSLGSTSSLASTTSTGTSSSTANSKAAIANNFEQFLTLLTTQLKNQSPLEPLDTNKFTEQLVQFASVEQQLKTNDTLSALLSLSKTSTVNNAMSFVGSTITADGRTSTLANGVARWQLNAPRAGTATIEVKNAAGEVVATTTQTLQGGEETFAWNGRTSAGAVAPPGSYSIVLNARDATGTAMTVATDLQGVVDAVDLQGATPILKIGALTVPMDQVKVISRTP